MSQGRRALLIVLCSTLLGMITFVTMNLVSARTHAIERQTEAIEQLRRDCPCAKR